MVNSLLVPSSFVHFLSFWMLSSYSEVLSYQYAVVLENSNLCKHVNNQPVILFFLLPFFVSSIALIGHYHWVFSLSLTRTVSGAMSRAIPSVEALAGGIGDWLVGPDVDDVLTLEEHLSGNSLRQPSVDVVRCYYTTWTCQNKVSFTKSIMIYLFFLLQMYIYFSIEYRLRETQSILSQDKTKKSYYFGMDEEDEYN